MPNGVGAGCTLTPTATMVTANFGEMLEFFYTYTMIFMRGDAGGSPFRLHFAGRQTLRGNRIHQASVHMYTCHRSAGRHARRRRRWGSMGPIRTNKFLLRQYDVEIRLTSRVLFLSVREFRHEFRASHPLNPPARVLIFRLAWPEAALLLVVQRGTRTGHCCVLGFRVCASEV